MCQHFTKRFFSYISYNSTHEYIFRKCFSNFISNNVTLISWDLLSTHLYYTISHKLNSWHAFVRSSLLTFSKHIHIGIQGVTFSKINSVSGFDRIRKNACDPMPNKMRSWWCCRLTLTLKITILVNHSINVNFNVYFCCNGKY